MLLHRIVFLTRLALAMPAVAVYLFLVTLGLISGEAKNMFQFLSYVFLATGLAPFYLG